jgi:hypothetical protein
MLKRILAGLVVAIMLAGAAVVVSLHPASMILPFVAV